MGDSNYRSYRGLTQGLRTLGGILDFAGKLEERRRQLVETSEYSKGMQAWTVNSSDFLVGMQKDKDENTWQDSYDTWSNQEMARILESATGDGSRTQLESEIRSQMAAQRAKLGETAYTRSLQKSRTDFAGLFETYVNTGDLAAAVTFAERAYKDRIISYEEMNEQLDLASEGSHLRRLREKALNMSPDQAMSFLAREENVQYTDWMNRPRMVDPETITRLANGVKSQIELRESVSVAKATRISQELYDTQIKKLNAAATPEEAMKAVDPKAPGLLRDHAIVLEATREKAVAALQTARQKAAEEHVEAVVMERYNAIELRLENGDTTVTAEEINALGGVMQALTNGGAATFDSEELQRHLFTLRRQVLGDKEADPTRGNSWRLADSKYRNLLNDLRYGGHDPIDRQNLVTAYGNEIGQLPGFEGADVTTWRDKADAELRRLEDSEKAPTDPNIPPDKSDPIVLSNVVRMIQDAAEGRRTAGEVLQYIRDNHRAGNFKLSTSDYEDKSNDLEKGAPVVGLTESMKIIQDAGKPRLDNAGKPTLPPALAPEKAATMQVEIDNWARNYRLVYGKDPDATTLTQMARNNVRDVLSRNIANKMAVETKADWETMAAYRETFARPTGEYSSKIEGPGPIASALGARSADQRGLDTAEKLIQAVGRGELVGIEKQYEAQLKALGASQVDLFYTKWGHYPGPNAPRDKAQAERGTVMPGGRIVFQVGGSKPIMQMTPEERARAVLVTMDVVDNQEVWMKYNPADGTLVPVN